MFKCCDSYNPWFEEKQIAYLEKNRNLCDQYHFIAIETDYDRPRVWEQQISEKNFDPLSEK